MLLKEITNLEEIKEMAIAVKQPIKVYWPQIGQYETLAATSNISILNNGFDTNNGIIAFVSDNVLYVIPNTRKIKSILLKNGFVHKDMYVPFSNWDYPVDYKNQWRKLQDLAFEEHKVEFVDDCNKFADKHGFGELNSILLEKCFQIPQSGIDVKHPYYETTYYPEIKSLSLDCIAVEKIGKYSINNSTCVFVYRDGKTYVTRSMDVVEALHKIGYIDGNLFVPFSNGETIENPTLAYQWKQVSSAI